jgi:hypothetical protein
MQLLNEALLRVVAGWHGLQARTKDESGQTLAEYGLIMAVIAVHLKLFLMGEDGEREAGCPLCRTIVGEEPRPASAPEPEGRRQESATVERSAPASTGRLAQPSGSHQR